MRQIQDKMQSRALQNVQTVSNNANPSMEVIVTRPRTPIFNKRFWQEAIITAGATAACTSVAVRRMTKYPDKVYVSYVSEGTLTVKSAMITYPIKNMAWITEETVTGCDSCALEFEGSFVRVGRNVEFFTEATPWIFYTTLSGELRAMLLGSDSFDLLSSSGVTTLDVVRGISNKYKDIDQGLIVFYIFNYTVYYQQLVGGVWQGQHAVDTAPATPAIQVKAERMFDYRICLHITDSEGALWEVFTKMAASGWNGHEYISADITATLQVIEMSYLQTINNVNISTLLDAAVTPLYALSPVMISAQNIANNDGNYGYLIHLKMNESIYNTDANVSNFIMTDANNTILHCIAITNNGREIILQFPNFNNFENPVTLEYTPGTVTGDIVSMDADSLIMSLTGLVPTIVSPPVPVSIENIINWLGVD